MAPKKTTPAEDTPQVKKADLMKTFEIAHGPNETGPDDQARAAQTRDNKEG